MATEGLDFESQSNSTATLFHILSDSLSYHLLMLPVAQTTASNGRVMSD
jgi:hypothetical protein